MDGWYNVKSKAKGPKDFLSKRNITKFTPHMIAYTALQVPPLICHTPALTTLLADICSTIIHETMGRQRWNIPPDPLLPPHHADIIKRRPMGDRDNGLVAEVSTFHSTPARVCSQHCFPTERSLVMTLATPPTQPRGSRSTFEQPIN